MSTNAAREYRSWIRRGFGPGEAVAMVMAVADHPVLCPLCLLPSSFCSDPWGHDQRYAASLYEACSLAVLPRVA